jgi:SPFH domain/Band 7 family protein
MIVLRCLLIFAGIGLLTGAAALLAWDLYQILKFRKKPADDSGELRPPPLRWREARSLAGMAAILILAGMSIAVVPAGSAGVRSNEFSGTRPATLYPGVHFTIPLIEEVNVYNTRDQVFATAIASDPKKKDDLIVQTREGLKVGLSVAVRYRIDPSKLAYIHSNLPQSLEEEMIAPVVASAFRDLAPEYLVRELFSTKREQVRAAVNAHIAAKLGPEGILVKDLMVRDVRLSEEYAKGLEGLTATRPVMQWCPAHVPISTNASGVGSEVAGANVARLAMFPGRYSCQAGRALIPNSHAASVCRQSIR